MTNEQMRAEIMTYYRGENWRKRVAAMPDSQVQAIYFKKQEMKRLEEAKK